MKINTATMSLTDYLGQVFECDCGKTHSTKVEAVEIGKDALESLPLYLKKFRLRNAYVACDMVTYEIAGKKVMEILNNANIVAREYIFQGKVFVPDEKAVGELLADMDKECDVVIAVGTGSINDIVRFFSYKIGRPFITVATAAPMDGFASSIAALIINNYKTTFETHTPKLIIGDTEILKNAPIPMITAGLGDILGKFTCLCDWKLSRLINGEYICKTIVDMVNISIQQVYNNAHKARERDSKVIGQIMEALVLTGVAMSFVGNSRPAAGCEHHFSHYWEMLFMQQGLPPVLHGTKVGIATVMILKIAEILREYPVNFTMARKKAIDYDPEKWEADIRRVYGPAADGIIKLEYNSKKNNTAGRLKRLDAIEAHWHEICSILKNDLPKADEMKALLKHLDSPYFPAQKGIDDGMLHNAVVYAKETRSRYTMLQMIWDLGLSEYIADTLVEYVNLE